MTEVGWRLNPRLLGLLYKKGVRKVGDVLFLLPRVYEDRRKLKKDWNGRDYFVIHVVEDKAVAIAVHSPPH